MPNPRLISRKQLSGESDYSFCPFCLKELRAEGKEPKDYLQPLFQVKTMTYQTKQKRDTVESHYECPRCKRADITVDTFLEVYCC